MPSLLALPVELIAHILSFLPYLNPTPAHTPSPTITISPTHPLTPPVCRTSRTLRHEALPLYAKTNGFLIQCDESFHNPRNRLTAWLDVLGDEGLRHVRSLQLSMHWRFGRPERGLGHVGFYVRLRKGGSGWECEKGTYPMANDVRGMRLECVTLLQEAVGRWLEGRGLRGGGGGDCKAGGLVREDVEFVVRAMDVVARHPIAASALDQSERGGKGRRAAFEKIVRELKWVETRYSQSVERSRVGHGVATGSDEPRPYFTPY